MKSAPRPAPLRTVLFCALATSLATASEQAEHPQAQPPAEDAGHETHAAAKPAEHPATQPAEQPEAKPAAESDKDQIRAEYNGVMRIGARKLEARDAPAAIMAFREALRLAKGEEKAPALLNLARAHRIAGDGVKAVATYELLLRDYPSWDETPLALIELGRALRELGAPKLALARFYSVIQSTLRLPQLDSDRYRQLVRTAQFEIAETHFASGDHAEAARFFKRLDLLDLAPQDRARARFRAAQALLQAGDRPGAITALVRYLSLEGDMPDAAEVRFTLARLYAEDGRREEAMQVALELLRTERAGDDVEAWRAWQRRTGQFLAEKFSGDGDTYSALLLNRALAGLDAAPEWRAPALYQVALCLEKLKQTREAGETYAEIIKLIGDSPAPVLADLRGMAKWRGEQLDWAQRASESIRDLAAGGDTASSKPAPSP